MVGLGKGSSYPIWVQNTTFFQALVQERQYNTNLNGCSASCQALENLSTLEKSGFSELFSIIFKKSAPEGLTNRGVCSRMLLSKDIINNLLDKSNINNH
jgi:hypothetical protein